MSWNDIRRAAVYHAPTSMPISQVSLRSSSVQNPHQNIREKDMMLPQRSNLASFKSIIANAIKIISNISFGNDAGIGIDILPLHMIKKLTTMSVQKTIIL